MNAPLPPTEEAAALERAAKRVSLIGETWLSLAPPVRTCGPVFARLVIDGTSPRREELASAIDAGLHRILARLRRAAARMGANKVVGFEIEVDPFGSQIEFSARGLAVYARRGPP